MQPTHVRVCEVEGCGGRHKARGLCLRHYQNQWTSENREKTREAVRASKAKKAEHYREQNARWWRENPDYQRQRYAREPERFLARHREYRRLNPERRRATVARWAEAHRAEIRAAARAYAVEHPDRRRLIQARRRARIREQGCFQVSDRDVARLFVRHRGCCAYCARQLSEVYHLDHIVPLARGGHHAIGNLAPACPDCNLSKGSLLLTEWQMRQQRA